MSGAAASDTAGTSNVSAIGTQAEQDARNAARFRALRNGTTQEEALALYDSLPAVPPEDMLGDWKGSGFLTDHPLDGLLETYHWYGKRFEDENNVHPLVFTTAGERKLSVNPIWTPSGLLAAGKLPKSKSLGNVTRRLLPLFSTKHAKARLRSIEHRGVVTSAMQYDQLPINDVFRRVDADTRLGVMDLRGMERPFFFVLEREQP